MIRPTNYYQANDSMALSLSEIDRNIKCVEAFAQEYGCRVFWRGQANHEWGLVSSLVRRLAISGSVDDNTLNRVEDKLFDEASTWIKDLSLPHYKNPLAQLAYLQHHKVPTRLLDFTSSPWMAVFFAAESHDDVDGRIFAILVDKDAVLASTPEGTPWRNYKSSEIKIYDAVSANVSFPRLDAQRGVFALGRLPSTTPYRSAFDEELGKERGLLAEEVRRLLSIPFKMLPFDPGQGPMKLHGRAKMPLGLTFRLHVDKVSMRRDLAGMGSGMKISPKDQKITHHAVYPDVDGMVSHSKTLLGLDKGLLLI